jgi:4-amino-4-deoxy-L-arabinose transferase-like glycosyltransferase
VANNLPADDPSLPAGQLSLERPLALISRWAPWLLGLTTLAGAALRIYHLGDKALWMDEASIFWTSQGTFSEILENNSSGNSAPPLFVLLISAVLKLRTSEFALRAIPCIAGIALIPTVYLLASRYVEKPWALAAAALVALSPTQVLLSQQVREYSLAALLAASLTLATQAFLDRPEPRQTLTLGAMTVVAVFTQYGLALLGAALATVTVIWLVRTRQPARVWARWALVQAAALASIAAIVQLGLARQLADGKGGVTRTVRYLAGGYWDRNVESPLAFIVTRSEYLSGYAFPGAVFLLLLITGMLSAAGDRSARRGLAIVVASLTIAIGAALAHAYPFSGTRQNIYLTPMLYVMAAVGAAAIGGAYARWQPLVAVSALIAVTGLRGVRAYHLDVGMEPIPPLIAEFVEGRALGDELYVSNRTVPAFRYYNRESPLDWHAGIAVRRSDSTSAVAQVDSLIQRPGRLWLLFSDVPYERANVITDRFSASGRLTTVRTLGSAALYLVE